MLKAFYSCLKVSVEACFKGLLKVFEICFKGIPLLFKRQFLRESIGEHRKNRVYYSGSYLSLLYKRKHRADLDLSRAEALTKNASGLLKLRPEGFATT